MTIQFTSLAQTLPSKPAMPAVQTVRSVANMTSSQAGISLMIEAALKGSK